VIPLTDIHMTLTFQAWYRLVNNSGGVKPVLYPNLSFWNEPNPQSYMTLYRQHIHLFFQNSLVKNWVKQGAPKYKLVLGVPLYGRSYRLQDKNFTAPGSLAVARFNSIKMLFYFDLVFISICLFHLLWPRFHLNSYIFLFWPRFYLNSSILFILTSFSP
jgi:hypothetical protein